MADLMFIFASCVLLFSVTTGNLRFFLITFGIWFSLVFVWIIYTQQEKVVEKNINIVNKGVLELLVEPKENVKCVLVNEELYCKENQ